MFFFGNSDVLNFYLASLNYLCNKRVAKAFNFLYHYHKTYLPALLQARNPETLIELLWRAYSFGVFAFPVT